MSEMSTRKPLRETTACGNYYAVMTEPSSRAHDGGRANVPSMRREPGLECDPIGPGHDAVVRDEAIDWASTLQEHDRWLRTVVLARLGDAQAVEDVMQDVALAAVEQRAPITDPSKIAPWLYRLAVTRAIRYRRRHARFRKYVGPYARHMASSNGQADPDPLQWLIEQERRSLVQLAVARLRGRDAEILMLKYCEGWSYREIAYHLGITQKDVDNRLYHARRRLSGELARTGVSQETP
jgi:RNA polymerase sigma-70 factor, ECF subfamily